MPPVIPPSAGLRLPTGQVTVLLGPDAARRAVLDGLDDSTGRCAGGHAARVLRVAPRAEDPAAQRLAVLDQASRRRAALVLADRPTRGLVGSERRDVLAALRRLAGSGVAVLVDDSDPVAALAVAHGALRVGADGSLEAADLQALPA